MNPLFRFFIPIVLFSSCVSYQPDYFRPRQPLSSPAHPVNPELFSLEQNQKPNRAIVLLGEESIRTSGPLPRALRERLISRSLDGAIINYRAFSVAQTGAYTYQDGDQDFYTRDVHYAEYQPFIYLDQVSQRGFLDSVSMTVEDTAGVQRHYGLSFDWHGQVNYLPTAADGSAISSFDLTALLIQPWFFLEQMGSSWRSAEGLNPHFLQRRYSYPPEQHTFIPYQSGSFFTVYAPGPNLKLSLSPTAHGKYQLAGFLYLGKEVQVKREEFLGKLLKEWWTMPDGTKYSFRYFYKRDRDIPSDWIIQPKAL